MPELLLLVLRRFLAAGRSRFSGGNVDETRVVDLATGHIIWKDQGSLGVLFRQGSADFVVRLDHPGGDYDLLLVPASGNPRIIARQVFVSW